MEQLNIFLNFSNMESDARDFQNLIDDLLLLFNRIELESNIKLFYCKTALENFSLLIEMNNKKIHADKINENIDKSLNKATACEDIKDDICAYYLWHDCGPSKADKDNPLEEVMPLLKGMAYAASKYAQQKMFLLGFNACFNWKQKTIPIVYGIRQDYLPQIANIPYANNLLELDKLFRGARPRKLNRDDRRHVDKHLGKSPLLVNSRNKNDWDRIEKLLQKAISPKNGDKDLVNFDDEKKCFIWFECEGTNNQYHAYHLVKSEKGERDRSSKGEGKISETLRHVFEHLHPGCFR